VKVVLLLAFALAVAFDMAWGLGVGAQSPAQSYPRPRSVPGIVGGTSAWIHVRPD
jgi:hypothetical protein